MIERIQKGEAQGIICWKLDRLTRNPIDAGTISWHLQQGTIKHIQTYQRGFSPTDNVLMMTLEFGSATQFSLDLSVTTKRGQRKKLSSGWYPHKPPLGYLNNKYNLPDKPPIYKDPDRFDLVKKLWYMIIEQNYTVNKLYEVANDMGLTTDKGKKITKSKFYLTFKNPFYYGSFYWKKELYPGSHEPTITQAEYETAQQIISGRGKPRPKRHLFAYTGLIRCGECGASITAENKFKHQKNGNTHNYKYYRCTKKLDPNCSQKTIREEELEKQVVDVINTIRIPPEFHQWAIKCLKQEHAKEMEDRNQIIQSQQQALGRCTRNLDVIFEMRMNNEIEPDEYKKKKEKLLKEKQRLEELLVDSNQRTEAWLEKAEQVFSFAETARESFTNGSLETKKKILFYLGSNLLLKDRKLHVTLKKPLDIFPAFAPEVQLLHRRLEPMKNRMNQRKIELAYARNSRWGGLGESNP
ncbi:MAG: recombinase family protein [Candidatus Margulisbacteria bacterium]|nr:recombinase family protein [Candidatus Margulisiibacteriota bacterium]